MTVPGHAVPVLASLIREDLVAVPGPVLVATQEALAGHPEDAQSQLTACLAALVAGEPRRALTLLQPTRQTPRVTAALTAWARQVDGNWYPGDVGGETSMDLADAFVEPRPGEPLAELLEHVVRHGPVSLVTPRTLLETSLRNGAAPGVQQAVGFGSANLDALAAHAAASGRGDLSVWTVLAAADLARRAGLPQVDQLLATARAQYGSVGDGLRLALTFVVEGDWYAAPGSSPESLGLDLAPQSAPSPLPPADPAHALALYAQAEAGLGASYAPRLRAALALRRAALARASGEADGRRRQLEAALGWYAEAGDGAGYQLAAIHRMVADIDEGLLGDHALTLGSGWHPPARGPVADVLVWAETVGSRSWAVGLGRLVQRCAEQWDAARSAPRARIGYLAALQLISLEPRIPRHTFVTAVAHADSRNNLATNAQLRLERGFGPLFADTSTADEFAFAQKLEAALVLVSVLRDRSRGPAAPYAAERMALLRRQLAASADSLRAALPPWAGPVPRTMEELQAALAGMAGEGSLEAQAGRVPDSMVLMQHMQLASAESTFAMADVLAALIRAEAAQRAGRAADADRWFAQAVEGAGAPGVEAHLLPLALISARRLDEAHAALEARAAEIPDEVQLVLWLRVADADRAAGALTRLEASGWRADGWRDLLSVAELRLAQGDAPAARSVVEQAIADFEASIRLLLRDPERLDACDQPDVAALYTTLALTHLPVDTEPDAGAAEASFAVAELARSLTDDLAGPGGAAEPGERRTWQRAAAEYAAVANRLVVALTGPTPPADGFARLDDVDAALAAAEQALDARDPGVLLRRTARAPQPPVAELRRRLPEGMLLLEYLAVGDDLLLWAMTRDRVRAVRQRVRLRDVSELVRRLHGACADGRGTSAELSALLVEPFADLVRAHPRLVVVPFGPLHLVPFHALRLDDEPLALRHVVSYLPRAGDLPEDGAGPDRPAAATRPLVVGDPAFDQAAHPTLQQLPGSRHEAAAVAAALGVRADDVLVGPAATEAAVTGRLDACDLLHVSSHGHLDELSPFASSLVLAGADELTVADIAGLRFATDLAVLTGCDTGRGSATLGGDVVGLTRSLLRGGVGRAVVSLWPVDDWVAPVVMARFYAGLAGRRPPAYALADAQRSLLGMTGEQLRAAYAVLGGTPGPDASRRRGVELDPSLRDEDEIPEPLGGDAERFWAPFVLIG